MTRIFLTLSLSSAVLIGVAFVFGMLVNSPNDPAHSVTEVKNSIDYHMSAGLGGLIFAVLVHSIVFTYFMGTGRWIEETSTAYKLPREPYSESQSLKYGLLPGMITCIVLLVLVVVHGAMAHKAMTVRPDTELPHVRTDLFGISMSLIHLGGVCITIAAHIFACIKEFRSIERNGEIVDDVMSEVRRIRKERGLPLDAAASGDL